MFLLKNMGLVDTLSGCVFVMVGLARLRTQKDSKLQQRTFGFLVLLLLALSFLSQNVPVNKALPAMGFLIIQIITIMKEYERDKREPKEGLMCIALSCIAGVLLYSSVSTYEKRHGDKVEKLYLEAESLEED